MPRRRGETLVDLRHLLEDLRDAYAGAVEETILTELVANALDAGAPEIRFRIDATRATVVVTDNGRGMLWKDLREFHNLASSSKTRGRGIGFAGVGVKLALLVCREVVTESRRGKSHVATTWHLASRHKAPYAPVPPPGLVPDRGTAVSLVLENALSPLLDAGYVEHALRTHFAPLLDPTIAPWLAEHYPRGVRLVVDDVVLAPATAADAQRAPVEIRLGRRRKPAGLGWIARSNEPLHETARGIAVSTFGKVIRQGWDWLGVFPSRPDRIHGLIELPALAESLTLNKADFVRTGTRGAAYLGFRRAIQEAVHHQLEAWGDAADPHEQSRRRAARPVERDLERVLTDLASQFPLLASLVEQRAGGQKQLPFGGRDAGHSAAFPGAPAAAGGVAGGCESASREATATQAAVAEIAAPAPLRSSPESAPGPASAPDPAARGRRRPGRYGLAIEFEERPGDPEPGRLVESTVLVNSAHPAYRRAVLTRSEGYHLALAVAFALAPLAVGGVGEHAFITSFLSRWGEAVTAPRRAGR